jgi:putative Holliday junction resolvase
VSEQPPEAAKARGRVLALDLGDVRIGVAISDGDRRMAVPVGTVRTGAPQDLKSVAALVREHAATLVVVGHPLSMSGHAGPRARAAEEFAGALRTFLEVPVVMHDERLSTVQADRALRAAGASGRERRRVIDRQAATVILQSYLDATGGRAGGGAGG